jgi:hypothetical protein
MICTPSLLEANNKGVESLEMGDFSNAVCHIRHALEIAKSHFDTAFQSTARTQRHSRNILPLAPSVLRGEGMFLSSQTATSRNGFIVHSQGHRMVAGRTFSIDIVENGKIYSAIGVFNLALCSHLQAKSDQSYRHLSKAKALYCQSFGLLVDIVGCYRFRATGNAAVDLLTMALLNNLAHIQMETHELLKSGKVFRLLIQYALSVKARDCYLSSPKTTDDMIQQVDMYLSNAFYGFGSAEGAAAA